MIMVKLTIAKKARAKGIKQNNAELQSVNSGGTLQLSEGDDVTHMNGKESPLLMGEQ